ncbi:MAG: O-sialoglycoprotein endopeptidase (Glycoprotease) [Parcubacteria group bacterium GW2011_GWA2_49_9]|nr:MAG: O-sialoglycoprotein endopeptidase (Glycoprotease) [Parcubacteria group bacterium GW2011_GWA2_49_9]
MIVLGIETSCDETAISLIESENGTDISVLADKTLSQIELHKQYGGVFPNMAKREHSRNLIPLLKTVLEEAAQADLRFKIKDLSKKDSADLLSTYNFQLTTFLEREPELLEQFLSYIPTIEKPPIDAIAVTEGPGLEPCLWTGINLAKALSLAWDIPVIPVNHMEGHIFSSLLRRKEVSNSQFPISKEDTSSTTKISDEFPKSYKLKAISYPSLALLISGGHTELVLIKSLGGYEIRLV